MGLNLAFKGLNLVAAIPLWYITSISKYTGFPSYETTKFNGCHPHCGTLPVLVNIETFHPTQTLNLVVTVPL
jgi:hypothetical protein